MVDLWRGCCEWCVICVCFLEYGICKKVDTLFISRKILHRVCMLTVHVYSMILLFIPIVWVFVKTW